MAVLQRFKLKLLTSFLLATHRSLVTLLKSLESSVIVGLLSKVQSLNEWLGKFKSLVQASGHPALIICEQIRFIGIANLGACVERMNHGHIQKSKVDLRSEKFSLECSIEFNPTLFTRLKNHCKWHRSMIGYSP